LLINRAHRVRGCPRARPKVVPHAVWVTIGALDAYGPVQV
jgi:hypothetical protein